MPRTLVIVAAGALGREVAEYAAAAGWDVAGFLDDALPAGAVVGSLTVLGRTDVTPARIPGARVIAVGEPLTRRRLADSIPGVSLETVVHPTAVVSPAARIGAGAVIGPFAFVGPGACVGANVVLNTYASIGHDATAGDHAVLSPYATLNGGASLGAGGFLGTRATILPGMAVGAGSKVAAGAVVSSNVPGGSLVAGNPARGRVMFPAWDL